MMTDFQQTMPINSIIISRVAHRLQFFFNQYDPSNRTCVSHGIDMKQRHRHHLSKDI